jgi:hypothetical protein
MRSAKFDEAKTLGVIDVDHGCDSLIGSISWTK